MDGWTLLFQLREALNEASGSDWINDFLSYSYLYDGARELNARIASITATQTITTIASTAEYNLSPDCMGLYLKDRYGEFYIKTNDGTNDHFRTMKPYTDIVYDNQTTAVAIPNNFSIKHATSQVSNITGTASASGALSNGEATLTDTSSTTKFANVAEGDSVHNTTTNEHGIVISKTSNTALVTAIFDSTGTAADWTSADAYVIVPQGRMALVFDPPPSTSGYTVTVYYIKKPTPVFSPYRSYPFPIDCTRDLVEYAATKYKYRDRQPSTGDAFFKYFDRDAKLTGSTTRKSLARDNFYMNLKARRY